MSERKYKKVLTVNDAIRAGLTPADLAKMGGETELPKTLDWITLLKLLNAMIEEGPQFTGDTPITELLIEFGKAMQQSFLSFKEPPKE